MLSNPADRKALLNTIKEIDNSMTRVAAERDFQKDAITAAVDRLGLDKKYIRKLATIYHKQNFSEVQAEQEELAYLFEIITGGSDEQQEEA